jgi:alpha-L-rhamnosidase
MTEEEYVNEVLALRRQGWTNVELAQELGPAWSLLCETRPMRVWCQGRAVLGVVVGAVSFLTPLAPHTVAEATSGGPGAPQALTVDDLAAPVGIGLTDVYFGWHVADSRRGAVQSAYRIVVSRPARAGPARGEAPVVWDSGKVLSTAQAFVPYGGGALVPDTTYLWTVQTWDGSGVSGPLAPVATFDTGLEDSDWHADWIKRPTVEVLDTPDTFNVQNTTGIWAHKDEYSYVRKEAQLGGSPIVRARAYVSADQQYELYVNGSMAAKGEAYSYPDSQYYETTDVTHFLEAGEANAFGIIYDWQGPGKGRPEGTPGVIARITVLHADGSVDVITTDGTWEVLPGAWLPGVQRDEEGDPVDYTENINGPAEPIGWDKAGYLASEWQPAMVIGPHPTAPWTHLVSVRTRIVYQPVHAVSVSRLASGAVVADFGKVYAAIPSVTFSHGLRGRRVTMHAGYLLGPSGDVSTTMGTQHTNMSYSYVERGSGRETFRPFDYLGFRYLQIDHPGEMLTTKDIVVLTRHDAVPDENAGTFTSSDKRVDAVFDLGRHSALFTMQEQFIDTPKREKGPWLGDGANESETAMDAFGETNLTRKDLLEFAQSQARFWPNGAVNKIYPTALGAQDIPQATAYYAEWVWQYWIHTGDRALLTALYPVVGKVSDFFWSDIGSNGLVGTIPGPTDVPQFPTDTQLNLLADNVFNRVADVADALGRPAAEVAKQRERARELATSINAHLLLPAGHYTDGLDANGRPVAPNDDLCTCSGAVSPQVNNARALQFGIVPPSDVTTVSNYILSMPFSPPVVSAADVLDALRITGRDTNILHILADASEPGWANILARGGTFTWEMWNPQDRDVLTPPLASFLGNGDSRSHGFGSNVLVAIQQTMLGVIPTAPGYASFDVKVPLHALSYASGQVPTLHGAIEVAWSRPAVPTRPFNVDITVPANTKARVSIPAVALDHVWESGMAVSGREGVTSASIDGDYAVVEVGAGSYHFTSTDVPVAAIDTGDGALGRAHGDNTAERVAVLLGALGLVALAGTLLFERRRRSVRPSNRTEPR